MLRRCLSVALLAGVFVHAQDFDLVIRHGRVIDGSGRPAVAADVALRGDRVVAVGEVAGRGRTEIDAHGQIVAPGFIDVHTHSEDILERPLAENFLRMGVTTLVAGNCGSSKLHIGEFFAAITKLGVGPNVASLIGQGTVRGQVMGGSFMRPATPEELDRMRALVAQAMDDGAVGLSTGLIYLPGTFTKTEEIIELAKVAAVHGGIYTSHMRHENSQIFDALAELIRIAREAHIRAEVSHLKLSGPKAWGRTAEVIELLDRARAEGLEITHDQYVYTASSTGIATLVPSSAREGGTKAFAARLADPARRAKLVAEMKADLKSSQRGDYRYAVIASYQRDRRLNGKNVAQAAQLVRGSDSLDDQIELVLDIVAHGGAQGVFHGMNEQDLQKFLVLPQTMIASDSGVRAFGEGVPHPRGYGNNARVLARYVRELHLLTLEEAVRKMTSLPAQAFRLKNRGELEPGAVADVVIFDPDKVADAATFDAPHAYALGFSHVIVNGVPVIRDGAVTDARPGRPVRLQDN
jgi:N-acyl-D-amino-acid deacylase